MARNPTGLMRRSGSDVWQGRFRVPSEIWRELPRLRELGVKDIPGTQEFTRSMRERDKAQAALVYSQEQAKWQRKMDSWRRLLEHGYDGLSHVQLVALAGEQGRRVVAKHEGDPFDYPSPINRTDATRPLPDGKVSTGDPEGLSRAVRAFLSIKDEGERRKAGMALVKDYPEILEGLGSALAVSLEAQVGQQSEEAASRHGLELAPETRSLLNLEMLQTMGSAERSFLDRQQGDYSSLHGLDKAPKFVPASQTGAGREQTFTGVIERQRKLSAQQIDKETKSEHTLRKAESVRREFAAWRGSDSVSSVTYEEAERWRDELLRGLAKGGSRTSVRNKIGTIKSLINWAIRHNERDRKVDPTVSLLFEGGHPLEGLELPSREEVDKEARTLSKPVAKLILERSRTKLPPEFRFVPWLQAYSGARISEVLTLEKRDIGEYEGHWYFRIRNENAKGGIGRRIPLHRAVIGEGFLDYVEARPDGLLFADRPQAGLANRYREALHMAMTDDDGRDLLGDFPPSHSWRHLFRDISYGAFPMAAQYYVEGRKEGTSRDHYGGSAASIPELAAMMNKVKRLV